MLVESFGWIVLALSFIGLFYALGFGCRVESIGCARNARSVIVTVRWVENPWRLFE